MPCDYVEAFFVFNGKAVAREGKVWYVLDIEQQTKSDFDAYKIERYSDSSFCLLRTRRIVKKRYGGVNDGGYNIYYNDETCFGDLIGFDGNVVLEDISRMYFCSDIYLAYKKDGKVTICDSDFEPTTNITIHDIESYNESNGRLVAQQNGLWGYLDVFGEMIIPFRYQEIRGFENGLSIAMYESKYGILNEVGDIVIPFDYSRIIRVDENFVFAEKEDAVGVVDLSAKVVVPFDYQMVSCFGNYFIVSTKDGEGILNKHGQIIISPSYSRIELLGDGFTVVDNYGNYGYVDHDGNLIVDCLYDYINSFNGHYFSVILNGANGLVDVNGNQLAEYSRKISDNHVLEYRFEKFGVRDMDGNLIAGYEYDDISDFCDGIAVAKKGNLFGVIDEFGNTVVECEYGNISSFNNDGIAKTSKGNLVGYLYDFGRGVIDCKYDSIYEFSGELLYVKYNGTKGLINKNGEFLVEYCRRITDDLVIDYKYGKFGIRKIADEISLEYIYDEVLTTSGEVLVFKIGRLYGLLDKNGIILVPAKYQKIEEFVNGVAIVKLHLQYGVIDEFGNTVVACMYKKIYAFEGDYAKAELHKGNCYIDRSGNEVANYCWKLSDSLVVESKFGRIFLKYINGDSYDDQYFDEIGTIIKGFCLTKRCNLYGVITERGDVILDWKYDVFLPYRNGKAICYSNGKFTIEMNPVFRVHPIKCKVVNAKRFGVFVDVLYKSSKKNRITGLLHASDIMTNNRRLSDFRVGNIINLYVSRFSIEKQQISFSLEKPFNKRNISKRK